jgi:protein gp37
MRQAHWHTYQVLTKRHERVRLLLTGKLNWMAHLPHVWYGVSVEDRKYGLPRIACLRATPAQLRFLSIEPLLEDLGDLDLTGIDWVIVGGESGPQARPIKKEWVVSVFRQCRKQGVPFFFKQWGGVRKNETGRMLNGRTYDELPKCPTEIG